MLAVTTLCVLAAPETSRIGLDAEAIAGGARP
jgi:hypothetical protein